MELKGAVITIKQRHENPMAIRSKNALAQSLLKLMLTSSFDNISISEITEKAGLSRQTYYTNFNKKEEIIDYLLEGLFERYRVRLADSTPIPDKIIIDYFIFWDKNKDFLTLLFKHGLDHLFQEHNREFFMEQADVLDMIITADRIRLPYIKASLAGMTFELLRMWIMYDQGLGVDVLSNLADNLLAGNIFAD